MGLLLVSCPGWVVGHIFYMSMQRRRYNLLYRFAMSAQNAHCVVLPVLARVGRTWIPLSPALVGTGRGFHIRKRERRKTVGKNHQRVNGRLLKTNSDDDRQTDEQIVSVVSS